MDSILILWFQGHPNAKIYQIFIPFSQHLIKLKDLSISDYFSFVEYLCLKIIELALAS